MYYIVAGKIPSLPIQLPGGQKQSSMGTREPEVADVILPVNQKVLWL